jgi:hypothetical protein
MNRRRSQFRPGERLTDLTRDPRSIVITAKRLQSSKMLSPISSTDAGITDEDRPRQWVKAKPSTKRRSRSESNSLVAQPMIVETKRSTVASPRQSRGDRTGSIGFEIETVSCKRSPFRALQQKARVEGLGDVCWTRSISFFSWSDRAGWRPKRHHGNRGGLRPISTSSNSSKLENCEFWPVSRRGIEAEVPTSPSGCPGKPAGSWFAQAESRNQDGSICVRTGKH